MRVDRSFPHKGCEHDAHPWPLVKRDELFAATIHGCTTDMSCMDECCPIFGLACLAYNDERALHDLNAGMPTHVRPPHCNRAV